MRSKSPSLQRDKEPLDEEEVALRVRFPSTIPKPVRNSQMRQSIIEIMKEVREKSDKSQKATRLKQQMACFFSFFERSRQLSLSNDPNTRLLESFLLLRALLLELKRLECTKLIERLQDLNAFLVTEIHLDLFPIFLQSFGATAKEKIQWFFETIYKRGPIKAPSKEEHRKKLEKIRKTQENLQKGLQKGNLKLSISESLLKNQETREKSLEKTHAFYFWLSRSKTQKIRDKRQKIQKLEGNLKKSQENLENAASCLDSEKLETARYQQKLRRLEELPHECIREEEEINEKVKTLKRIEEMEKNIEEIRVKLAKAKKKEEEWVLEKFLFEINEEERKIVKGIQEDEIKKCSMEKEIKEAEEEIEGIAKEIIENSTKLASEEEKHKEKQKEMENERKNQKKLEKAITFIGTFIVLLIAMAIFEGYRALLIGFSF